MRILVTGGAGFIGSATVKKAIQKGFEVINLDALTYASDLRGLSSVSTSPLYRFEHQDIRDRQALKAVFKMHKPDAVLNLAAETHVDRSIEDPSDFIETNINGTYNLLCCALDYWTDQGRPSSFRFLQVSTDEVFGSLSETGQFSENARYNPSSPYSASKSAGDHLVRAWSTTYDLPVLLTNSSNNYGPNQYPEKLVPVTIINAISGRSLPIYGDGSNVRNWIYVEDHAEALLTVLLKGDVGRTYNIGGEDELSNLDLVEQICSTLDRIVPAGRPYGSQIQYVADRPGHDHRYALDTTRIKTELNWNPLWSLENGLSKTIKWYLENEIWWREFQSIQSRQLVQ